VFFAGEICLICRTEESGKFAARTNLDCRCGVGHRGHRDHRAQKAWQMPQPTPVVRSGQLNRSGSVVHLVPKPLTKIEPTGFGLINLDLFRRHAKQPA
jgi:hypothetical protein